MKRFFGKSIVGLLIVANCMYASDKASHRIGRIMGHVSPTGQSVSSSTISPHKVSATQGYLQHPSVYKRAKDYWDYYLVEHRAMAETFVCNEHALKDTHNVLYHAHNKSVCVFQDFITLLAQAEGKNVADFIPLRHWENVSPYPDTTSFLKAHESGPRSSGSWYEFDGPASIKTMLLSANLAIYGFGNNDLNRGALETTFEFFRKNTSLGGYLSKVLVSVFDAYGFDKRYIQDIENLAETYLRSQPGSFVQIFIPKHLVDKNVYISYVFGEPVGTLEIHNVSCTTPCSAVLELVRANPLYFTDVSQFKLLQARILLTPDMLTPDSGVKIMRHIGGMTPEQDALYQQELKALTKKIFASATKKKVVCDDQNMILPGARAVQLPVSDTVKKEVTLFFDRLTYQARLGKAVADNDLASAAKIFHEEVDTRSRHEAVMYVFEHIALDNNKGSLEKLVWLVEYCKADVSDLKNIEDVVRWTKKPDIAEYLKGLIAQRNAGRLVKECVEKPLKRCMSKSV